MVTLSYDCRQIYKRPKLAMNTDSDCPRTVSRGLSASAECMTSPDDSGGAISCRPASRRATQPITIGTPSTAGPLVERDGVLAELAQHAAAALSGAGRLVVVRGEAGIGKSSVVRAFCDDVHDGTVAIGHCDPVSAPVPLGPILGLCERRSQDVRARLVAATTGESGRPVFRTLSHRRSRRPRH